VHQEGHLAAPSQPERCACEDWWTMLIGLGGRWTVDPFDPEARERVRRANLAWLREHEIRGIEVNVLYAIATKP
jgi:hypothetical protein